MAAWRVTGVRVALAALLGSGCAVHWHDSNGADHVLGLSHVVTRASPAGEGRQAVVEQTTIVGVGLRLRDNGGAVSFGYDREASVELFDSNTSLMISGPEGTPTAWEIR